jgi:hypothetical protein
LDYELFHKSVGNYRQITTFKKLDVCVVIRDLNSLPLLKPAFEWMNVTFPGMVHPCPYAVTLLLHFIISFSLEFTRIVQDLKIANASLGGNSDKAMLTKDALPFPNGNYKMNIKYSDDIDDHIGSVKILFVVKARGRDVEF